MVERKGQFLLNSSKPASYVFGVAEDDLIKPLRPIPIPPKTTIRRVLQPLIAGRYVIYDKPAFGPPCRHHQITNRLVPLWFLLSLYPEPTTLPPPSPYTSHNTRTSQQLARPSLLLSLFFTLLDCLTSIIPSSVSPTPLPIRKVFLSHTLKFHFYVHYSPICKHIANASVHFFTSWDFERFTGRLHL